MKFNNKMLYNYNRGDTMFKDKLKKLRKDACETQAQLANALGVTQQAIDRWENARTEPNVTMLIQISKHFGVSVDYLLDNFDTESLNVPSRNDIVFSIVKMYEKLEPNEKRVLNKYIESVICSMGYVKNDETHVPIEEEPPQIVQNTKSVLPIADEPKPVPYVARNTSGQNAKGFISVKDEDILKAETDDYSKYD